MITKLLRYGAAAIATLVLLFVVALHTQHRTKPALLHVPVALSQSAQVARQSWLQQELTQAGRKLTIAAKPHVAHIPKPTPTPTPTQVYVPAPDPGTAQRIAWDLLPSYGFSQAVQFPCLVQLWNRESGWRWNAQEPTSGAYGIPQSLPASKMAQFGSDYLTNPRTQIRWGLWYIQQTYGTPCAAWTHDYTIGWY